MGYFALPVATALMGLILAVELTRKRKPFDTIFFFNLIYFLAFGLSPWLLHVLDRRDLGPWNWIYQRQLDSPEYLFASVASLVGYAVILLVYFRFPSDQINKDPSFTRELLFPADQASRSTQREHRALLALATLLTAVGSAALGVYAWELGGIENYLTYGYVLRANTEFIETKYGFLRNVAPLTLAGSFISYAVAKMTQEGVVRFTATLLFLFAYSVSVMVLFQQAGRLSLFSYVATFPLCGAIMKGGLRMRTVALGFTFVIIILLGRELFNILVSPEELGAQASAIADHPKNAAMSVLVEFSFPFVNLANVIDFVPDKIPVRWFLDVPLGLAYLVPKKVFSVSLPETPTMLYSALVDAPIPIDLLSFGYVSLMWPGLLLIAVIYGIVLRWMESVFPDTEDPLHVVFRVSWAIFLASRVMYGDPQHAFAYGFYLIVGTMLVLVSRRQVVLSRTDAHCDK